MPALHYDPINHCHVISVPPVHSHVLQHLIFFSGQPTMMYPFGHCKWLSCVVACCNCGIDMHSRMFVAVCIASTFLSMPGISVSLFSVPCLYGGWSILQSGKLWSTTNNSRAAGRVFTLQTQMPQPHTPLPGIHQLQWWESSETQWTMQPKFQCWCQKSCPQ